ncbi:hypothetical protein FN846DRAFT_889623 [Sphaerosporella brunnea]|uniref:RAD52 homolog n=1 Tax=Sphaerosporella brunnea TaxID=1250544 RepID=A0A5J5EZ93_9PEZI|nr:hypothetical protein FN846DRAFT_889623 [Sphaerosporella brunnea]
MPGAQHNPYEERQISPYTAIDIATLQAKLDQQLGPEFISSRPGAGGKKVHYIQADKCINLANQVFGFNGWSSSITNMEVDFLDQGKDGKWSVGISVTVRVTLKDGTYHEDVGYGQMENGKKAQVFEKAKKEGTTDGLKRALRSFGNVLGNCLYDKEYLAKISRVKSAPNVFDEKRLHRHGDEMKPVMPQQQQMVVKQEPGATSATPDTTNASRIASPEPFDEYGGDEFEELGIFAGDDSVFDGLMPDEVTIDNSPIETPSKPAPYQQNYARPAALPQQQKPPAPISSPTKQLPQQQQQLQQQGPPPPIGAPLRPGQPQPQARPMQRQPPGPPQQQQQQPPSRPVSNMQPPPPRALTNTSKPPTHPPQPQSAPPPPAPPPSTPHNPPVGFFTGRAAMSLKSEADTIPEAAPAFNPHRPTTIPRSAGIDHTKSSPIARKMVQPQQPPNFQNPSLTPGRQIGMPRTSAYRAPTVAGTKRAADGGTG